MENEKQGLNSLVEKPTQPDDMILPTNLLSVLRALSDTDENGASEDINETQPEAQTRNGITLEELREGIETLKEQSRSWSYCDNGHGFALKERRPTRQRLHHIRENAIKSCNALILLELFILQLEENPQDFVILGRLSRELLPEEVFLYRPRWCFYYWRCLIYASDMGFRSFACVKCPRFDFKGVATEPKESDLNEAPAKPSETPVKSLRTIRLRRMPKPFKKRFLRAKRLRDTEPPPPAITLPASPPAVPAIEEKRHLKLISTKQIRRVIDGENGKRGYLELLELFFLHPEENYQIKIKIGKLSRRLWTDESETHYKKDCDYFTRCLEFSIIRKFNFTCATCPLALPKKPSQVGQEIKPLDWPK